jgi:hypothetical protein
MKADTDADIDAPAAARKAERGQQRSQYPGAAQWMGGRIHGRTSR